MAKESMKAREVKRAKLVAKYAEKKKQKAIMRRFNCCRKTLRVYVCTTVVKSPVVPKDISVNSGYPVYSSAKWLRLDLSRA